MARRPAALRILHSKAIALADAAYTAGFEAAKATILANLQTRKRK